MLTATDFILPSEKGDKINEIIGRYAKSYVNQCEYPLDEVSVTFEFSPYGHEIYLTFDSGPRELI